jgi:hypothetical protein
LAGNLGDFIKKKKNKPQKVQPLFVPVLINPAKIRHLIFPAPTNFFGPFCALRPKFRLFGNTAHGSYSNVTITDGRVKDLRPKTKKSESF